MRADGRLDGHIVQGHVDGTGVVLSRTPGDRLGVGTVRVAVGSGAVRGREGSIAVDGVSLTVADVGNDWFESGLIPQTLRATTLGRKGRG